MGFNKQILPPLEIFKQRLKENPSLLENISKADSIMGPPETIAYLKQLWNNTPALTESSKEVQEKSPFLQF